MRISDWSSDVCSSDLCSRTFGHGRSNSIRFAQNPGCASLARATGYGLRAGGVQRSTVRTGHHRDGRGAGDGATPRTRPMERVSGLRQTRVLCVHLTSSSSNREGVSPTRPDCPSYSVVVLAQWQLVSLHEVPVSPAIQVSQPFRPAWGEFGPLPVASLQETATEDADASGQEDHTSNSLTS